MRSGKSRPRPIGGFAIRPAAANRLDYIGARIGLDDAARYVRLSNGSPA